MNLKFLKTENHSSFLWRQGGSNPRPLACKDNALPKDAVFIQHSCSVSEVKGGPSHTQCVRGLFYLKNRYQLQQCTRNTMARINVEDKWFCDPRREILKEKVGRLKADGVALNFWKIAQEYYRLETIIPKEVYFECENAREFLEARLAEDREDGVYIKGSRELFDWIHQRKEAGKRGGLAKASNAKQNLAKGGKGKQSLPSSSSSSSKEKEDGEKNIILKENTILAFYNKWGKDFVDETLPLVIAEIREGNPAFEHKPDIVRIRQMLQRQHEIHLSKQKERKSACWEPAENV